MTFQRFFPFKNLLCFFFLLIFINVHLSATETSGTLTGLIVEAESELPLKNVVVKVEGTEAVAVSDKNGRFKIENLPPGKYNLRFVHANAPDHFYMGQKIISGETHFVKIQMSAEGVNLQNVIFLGGIEVVANKNLFEQRTATTTTITSGDIEHNQAISLGDVLDFVPGVEMKNQPALKEPIKAHIRNPNSSDYMTAFASKIIVDGVPYTNNANMQGTLAKGVYTGTWDGVDLREIPADNIESVEVIRGIAPAQYGDFTGGLIHVKTKVNPSDFHRFKIKNNPDTREMNLGGSAFLAKTGIHYNLNWGYSQRDIRNRYDNTQRLAGQLVFTNQFFKNKLFMKNQFKYSRLFENIEQHPTDPDSIASYNKGYRFIFGNTMNYKLDNSTELNSNFYVNYRRVNSFQQFKMDHDVGIVSPLIREGTTIGIKRHLPYLFKSDITGDEIAIGHQIYWKKRFTSGLNAHTFLVGNDFKFDDNIGKGREFDVTYPPRTSERPRLFDDVSGIFQHSIFLNYRIESECWKKFTLDLGLRYERYNTGEIDRLIFFESKNGAFFNPRINFALYLAQKTRIRAGYGKFSKAPPINYIYPDLHYTDMFDKINVNDTTVVSDSVITTRIFDPANPFLKGIQENKFEISLDQQFGSVFLTVSGFYSERTNEPMDKHYPVFYYQFLRPNWPLLGNESKQDSLLKTHIQKINGGRTKISGVEFSLKTKYIEKLNMNFAVDATFHHVRKNEDGLNWSTIRQDYTIPLYKKHGNWLDKVVLTFRMNYMFKKLGIWFSLTAQQVPLYQKKRLGLSDTLAVAYYDGLSDQVYPIDENQQADPKYAYYHQHKNPLNYRTENFPGKWLFNLTITKSIFKAAEISFYVNNFFNYRAYTSVSSNTDKIFARNPEIFYGIQFSVVMDKLFEKGTL